MNYYERHLGDYAKDTAHLSMIEHGAYNLLMDRYYATEAGIPADQVHRVARARNRDEKNSVDAILEEFFSLVDGVWIHKRIDAEISKFQAKVPAQQESRENAKERQQRARERRKKLFETLRDEHGITMPFDATTAQLETELSRVTIGDESYAVTQPVTRDNTCTQTPDTSHQTPDTSKERGRVTTETSSPELTSPTPQGLICKAIKDAGIPSANPSHPTLLALIAAGATVDEFRAAAGEAVRANKPSFAYVIGTVKGRREDAANLQLHKGRLPNKQEALEQSNASATAGWMPPELREKTA